MITHTIESYRIPSQKKIKSKFQIWRICQNFKFFNFETNYTCKIGDKGENLTQNCAKSF